jgi:spermidine synthase
VVFLPTFLMGMTFPLVSQLYAGHAAKLGRRIGSIIAVNTAGAVLGSFAAGFVLIPWLGTQATLVALSVANALLGGVLLLASRPPGMDGGRGRLGMAAAFVPALMLLGAGLVLPPNVFLPVFANNLRGGDVVYAREGITGTVTIHQSPASRILSINGVDVAGTSFMLRTTQKLQAHIPLLLHPDPRDVLQVGLGSGETAHSILLHPIRQLVGCDISPEVIEAGPYFEAINRSVYEDPRLKIVIEDAKNYVACTDRTFDLILNDSVHPIFRGSSDLYARDYFEACRARLRDGGMMSSWFPIALLAEDDLLMLMRTFHEVFPTSTVWVATNGITRNALLLGWKDDRPLSLDVHELLRKLRSPAILEDLAEVRLATLPALLDAFMLDPAAMEELTRGAGINTYDRPHLEFSAPKVLARGDRVLWARNFETIVGRRSPVLPYLVNLGEDRESASRVRERFERRAEASQAVIRGLQLELDGRTDLAQAAYREALEVLPGDPLASGLVERDSHLRTAAEANVAAGSTDPDELYLVGRWRREAGEFEEAESLLRRAVEARPQFLQAHVELAQVLVESGDLAGAGAAMDRVLELDSRAPEAWAMRGRIRAQQGDRAGAESDLRRATDQGAALPWAELLLGRILLEKGEGEEGRAHLREAVRLAPDSPAGREAQELLGK